jgi:hypothetical protein
MTTYKYQCLPCGKRFDWPARDVVGVSGAQYSNASPCCHHHFLDEKSKEICRPCSVDCCTEENLDPEDAKRTGYKIRKELITPPEKAGPKRLPGMNHKRAAKGRVAILAFARACRMGKEDMDTIVGDLLGDLMHACDEAGIDFADTVRTAYHYYSQERQCLCLKCFQRFDGEADEVSSDDLCVDCEKKQKAGRSL